MADLLEKIQNKSAVVGVIGLGAIVLWWRKRSRTNGNRSFSALFGIAAIGLAVATARAGDVVLVAGKGHEPYQERNGVRTPFSDVEIAAAALAVPGDEHA